MLEFCSHEAIIIYNVKFRRFCDCLNHCAVVPIILQSVYRGYLPIFQIHHSKNEGPTKKNCWFGMTVFNLTNV
jgi:hypothetical protein